MEKEGYSGLSEKEVRERISKGLVNETNTSVSKTTGQIIRTHSLTYFNFLNIFLGALVVVSGQIKNLTLWPSLSLIPLSVFFRS